jgi:hypothetical protein
VLAFHLQNEKPQERGPRPSESGWLLWLDDESAELSFLLFFLAQLTVLFLESLDATGAVHVLLLAGEKRMAGRANLQVNLAFGRSRVPRLATGATDNGFDIFRMNSLLHATVSFRS